MKAIIGIISIIICACGSLNAQKSESFKCGMSAYQTVDDINDLCLSRLSFKPSVEAESVVKLIMQYSNIIENEIVLLSCNDLQNAIYVCRKDNNGILSHYILYNQKYLNRVSNRADADWSAMFILAHELGHYVKKHILPNNNVRHKFELEADNWAASVLSKMGATIEEINSAFEEVGEDSTASHPAKWKRLKAVEDGWLSAQTSESLCNLGINYYKNSEFTSAKKCYERSSALGNYRAKHYLGCMYLAGVGVEQNYNTAIYWHYESAKQGFDSAQCALAHTYLLGPKEFINHDSAYYWYKKSSEKGSAHGLYGLGFMYFYGYGVPSIDYAKARDYFEESAKLNDINSQCYLGYLYRDGYNGVKKDEKLAINWFTKAAERGDTAAQYELGALLCNTTDKALKDYNLAFYWMKKAADQGYPEAYFALGIFYEYGNQAVQRDVNFAINMYRKAANKGHIEAQNALKRLNN